MNDALLADITCLGEESLIESLDFEPGERERYLKESESELVGLISAYKRYNLPLARRNDMLVSAREFGLSNIEKALKGY